MADRLIRVLALLAAIALMGPVSAAAQTDGDAVKRSGVAEQTPSPQVDKLWQVLRLAEMMSVMQQEALSQADEMAGMLFERGSEAGWRDRVGAIHDPKRLDALLRAAVASALADQPVAVTAQALHFFESPLGVQIVASELEARRAIVDQDIEDGAIAAYRQADAKGAARLAQIDRLVQGADLIEPTITAAMNESLAFSKGFAARDGYQIPVTDGEILAETWAMEPEIRATIEEWVPAFLMLAYSALSDAEMDEYLEYATSKRGKAMWQAMNSAYEQIYVQTSREMGEAAALHVSGLQL